MEEQKVWYCDFCAQYHFKRNMSDTPKICIFCKENNINYKKEEETVIKNILAKEFNFEREFNKIKREEELRVLKGELKIQKEQIKLEKEQSKLREIKLKIEEDEKLKILKEQLKFEKNERLKLKRKKILLNEWGKPETEKKLIKRDIYYKTKFGISLNDYNKILTEQNGCCDICKIHQSELVNTLCVDHNHETGEIRGLLCNNCNAALGFLKEKIEISLNLIEYIKKYQKDIVK
jgi:hypothetical protein